MQQEAPVFHEWTVTGPEDLDGYDERWVGYDERWFSIVDKLDIAFASELFYVPKTKTHWIKCTIFAEHEKEFLTSEPILKLRKVLRRKSFYEEEGSNWGVKEFVVESFNKASNADLFLL